MKRLLLLILSLLLIVSSSYAGQTVNGGRSANDDLTLQGTTSSTRDTSYVIVQPSGGKVLVGTSSASSGATLEINGTISAGGALTAGGTNTFSVTNGTASLDVAANSTVNVDKSLTVNGTYGTTLASEGQANTLTLNESLTIGDGNSGTVTFSAASKTLTVEDTSVVNQDLSSDASPTFAKVNALKEVTTYSANGNVATTAMDGGFSVITGAYELELPTAAVGYDQTFYASTAAVFSLDVQTGTDVVVLNGTALAAGNKASTDGTIYNTLRVRCFVTGKYHINSLNGLAVDGGV